MTRPFLFACLILIICCAIGCDAHPLGKVSAENKRTCSNNIDHPILPRWCQGSALARGGAGWRVSAPTSTTATTATAGARPPGAASRTCSNFGPWNVSYPKTIYDDCILCYYVWQKYCSWKIEFIGANLSWPLLTDPSKLGLPLILKYILKVVLCYEEVKSYFVSVSHVTVSNYEQMFVVCLKSELSSWRPLILPIILFPFVMSGIRKNHK